MVQYKISKQKKKELEARLGSLETKGKEEMLKFLADNPLAESWHQAASVEAQRNAFEKELKSVKEILNNCEVIDESGVDRSKVSLGVTVRLVLDDEKLEFKIVSSVEVDPAKNMISLESPLGKLLAGKKVGDVVELPNGDSYTVSTID